MCYAMYLSKGNLLAGSIPEKLHGKYLYIGSFFSTDFYYNFRGVFLLKVHLLQHFIVEVILRISIFISRTILHLSTCHLCTSNFPLCFVQCQWNEQVMESDFTQSMKCVLRAHWLGLSSTNLVE